MGKYDKMFSSFWENVAKRKPLFKARVPNLKEFEGRDVIIKGKKIRIKTIVGNLGLTLGRQAKDVRPQYYEINGKHLISMLRFHAQMEGVKDITEEQFQDFEKMEFYAEKMEQLDGKTQTPN